MTTKTLAAIALAALLGIGALTATANAYMRCTTTCFAGTCTTTCN